MSKKTSLPENPAEEPDKAGEGEIIAGESNVSISLENIEGAKIDISEPPEGRSAVVENSLAFNVSAQHDALVENSLVMAVAAGSDLISTNSLGMVVTVGNNLKIEQGGAGVIKVGGKARIKNGTIGLLIAKSEVTLTDSQVLMTTSQAIALGAAFGTVYALLRTLLGGRKRG